MSVDPQVQVAAITTVGGTIGAFLLYLRRRLPPRPRTSGDVEVDALWAEMRKLRDDMKGVVDERDTTKLTAQILAAATEALMNAVERTIPPIVLTPAERQAIERAKQRKTEDDSTWPTLGGTHTPS